jgi:hypothetical protein
MKKFRSFLIILCLLPVLKLSGQETPVEKGLRSITDDAIKAQLGFLASNWTEGRMIGERGASLSADYIVSILQLCGVKPGGDFASGRVAGSEAAKRERTWFQNFVLLKTSPGEQELSLRSSEDNLVKTIYFNRNTDFTFRSSENSFESEAPVIFVGHGFINNKLKYNDFDKTDAKGKFILKISGIPTRFKESLTREEMMSSNTETETAIREMGIAGIIEVNPMNVTVGNPERPDFENMSPSEGNVRPGRPYASYSIAGKRPSDNIIRITVSVKTANEILKGSGFTVEDYLKKEESGETPLKPLLKGKTIRFKSMATTTQVPVKNIIGIIEGNNPDQVIVLGAHYDHMGMGNGYIWNGADDNGSGTVGVMTIAKAIMETGKKPDKTIVVALWTAEEEGLLGSRYFVQSQDYPVKDIKLNMNFDMISRYISPGDPKKVTMTYTGSFPSFQDLTTGNIKKYGIDLVVDYQPSADPPGGTDHRSFVAAGIPIIRFKPGHREEYHTPKDELSTVNWDIMKEIIRINFADVWELANTSW